MRILALAPLCALGLAACQQNPRSEASSQGSAGAQVARPGSAPTTAAPDPAAPPVEFAPIQGTVVLGEGLGPEDLQPNDVIFVMARTPSGALVAANIIEEVAFPAAFRIDDGNLMGHGAGMEPPYVVSARLDRDRDAMTKGPDDLYTALATPVKGGETGVRLVLQKKVGGPASRPAAPAGAAPGGAEMPNDAVHGGLKAPNDAVHGGGGGMPNDAVHGGLKAPAGAVPGGAEMPNDAVHGGLKAPNDAIHGGGAGR